MSSTPTSHQLDVPGACLHFQTIGSGPVLAMLGLPMVSSWFTHLASHFGDHTVVTYDPRGFGRSTIDDPEQDSTPELVADDVHRVLREVTDEPALVFGSSGGAVIGLELVTQHPNQVRALVAHEPPVVEMLPDAERVRDQVRDIYDTYRREGTEVALRKFMAVSGFEVPKPDPGEASGPPLEQNLADHERMLAHSLLPTAGYQPNIAALRAATTRVVIAGGAASHGQLPLRTADALAKALGSQLVEFPGDHGGFLHPSAGFNGEPAAFARVLRQVFAETG